MLSSKSESSLPGCAEVLSEVITMTQKMDMNSAVEMWLSHFCSSNGMIAPTLAKGRGL